MKILHLADLHIGIKINEYSMLDEQRRILGQILDIAAREKPQAAVIAGDLYDRLIPPPEAVSAADDFLTRLAAMGIEVFVISGNHDSADRIAFGSRLMENSGVHMSPVYRGEVTPVTLSDEYGEVNFYMLPFISPLMMRKYSADRTENAADEDCGGSEDDGTDNGSPKPPKRMTYSDEVRLAVERMSPDYSARNVIISHQYVTGGERSESERVPIGGLDNVDAEVYARFDYAALGHLHRPQTIASHKNICYSGSPLRYSLSEVGHDKSVTIAELKEKGSLELRTVPLTPERNMIRLSDSFDKLLCGGSDDYVFIELTDELPVADALSKLRPRYPNILSVRYTHARVVTDTLEQAEDTDDALPQLPPDEQFARFFELRSGKAMTDSQRALVSALVEKIWEEHAE